MLQIKTVQHIAIITSDYARSLHFYTHILGMEVMSEEYRAERKSMLTKLSLNGTYLIELFTFPDSPPRLSYPEACGLRHLAFEVPNMKEALRELEQMGVKHESVRALPNGSTCCFLHDPDGLPIELVATR